MDFFAQPFYSFSAGRTRLKKRSLALALSAFFLFGCTGNGGDVDTTSYCKDYEFFPAWYDRSGTADTSVPDRPGQYEIPARIVKVSELALRRRLVVQKSYAVRRQSGQVDVFAYVSSCTPETIPLRYRIRFRTGRLFPWSVKTPWQEVNLKHRQGELLSFTSEPGTPVRSYEIDVEDAW